MGESDVQSIVITITTFCLWYAVKVMICVCLPGISCTTVVVHNRDRPCFLYTPNTTHTQTQAGEVTTKALKALEVYLVMQLVL